MPPGSAAVTVDLGPGQYQGSLISFRNLLENTDSTRVPFLQIAVKTPNGQLVQLQIRTHNAYLVGFEGEGSWYSFDGETGGWGPSCGTGSNYNDLGQVGRVGYDDLNAIGALARFRKGRDKLDKRLIAILIAITSEAARFATVSTYFTGLTNAVGTEHSGSLLTALGRSGIDFEYLKRTYFTQWEKPPSGEMEVGKVYHHRPEGILFRHRK
jgi:hypothetical protein